MMFSAILFDFDGTLVDSNKSIFDEYIKVSKIMGLREISFREFSSHLGRPWNAALEELWPGVDKKKFTGLYRREREATPILEGVYGALVDLSQNYSLGILTSRGKKTLHIILDAVGINDGRFDFVFSKESLSSHKPDPRALTEAVEKMGLGLKDVIYIGDSVIDAECAHKAGVSFVGVLSGGTLYEDFIKLGVKQVIDSVAKLPKLVKQIEDEA